MYVYFIYFLMVFHLNLTSVGSVFEHFGGDMAPHKLPIIVIIIIIALINRCRLGQHNTFTRAVRL